MAEQSDLSEEESLGHFVVIAEFCVFLPSTWMAWDDVPRHRSLLAEIHLPRGHSHLPGEGAGESTCVLGSDCHQRCSTVLTYCAASEYCLTDLFANPVLPCLVSSQVISEVLN
jgi:hypothetical protein